LKPATVRAFDQYIRGAEARVDERINGPAFLWTDDVPERSRRVRQGQPVTESLTGKGPASMPDGLVHDWIGAIFIPGAALDKTLALLEDYNNHKNIYKPEVIDSRILSRNGNDFRVALRLLKKKVITVVIDSEYDVRYFPLDRFRWSARSYSTRMAEVENAGKPNERALPPGKDHGFLWRLYSYWRYQQRDGGVYMECEAISLTRGIPAGLGWLIQPIIEDLPRESLMNTLTKTRDALRE
jgi:hypothetical protein